jgi:hypothetical protein
MIAAGSNIFIITTSWIIDLGRCAKHITEHIFRQEMIRNILVNYRGESGVSHGNIFAEYFRADDCILSEIIRHVSADHQQAAGASFDFYHCQFQKILHRVNGKMACGSFISLLLTEGVVFGILKTAFPISSKTRGFDLLTKQTETLLDEIDRSIK